MSFNSRKWRYFWYDIEERWKRLGIKKWIEQNPKAIIGITIVSLLLFIVVLVGQLTPDKLDTPHEPEQAWFYDLNTKKLFTAKSSKLPPIKAPSGSLPDGGPAGVRAYVFSCNDPNKTEPLTVIGFLEMFSQEGKESQKSYDPKRHSAKLWVQGRFFRHPEGEEWIPADSSEGKAIYSEFFIRENYKKLPVESNKR